jgi:hypothetical protein
LDNRDQTDEDLIGFPVLVRLDDTRIDYAAAAEDGADLRFVDATSGDELAYEIEEWNPAGESFVWVKVPRIVRGSWEGAFWIYFGNEVAATGARPAEVWSSAFAGVFHLNGDLLDSTANANHGTNDGATAGAGRLAGGRWFDHDDADKVTIGSVGLPMGASPRTLCAWAQTTDVTTNSKHWFISYGAFVNNGGFFIGRSADELWCGGVGSDIVADDAYRSATWQYLCCTFDGFSARIYVDGVLVQGPENRSAWTVAPGQSFLGSHINSGESWDGGLDEARISAASRSRDWIAAEYRTMTDQYVIWGALETRP